MDSTNSLKTWVRNHSPLKSRNKPLPVLPANKSPAGSPAKLMSRNTPPTRKATNMIRSLLKHKPHRNDDPTSLTSCMPSSVKHQYSRSQISRETDFHPIPRKSADYNRRGQSIDLTRLSEKVTSLEVQLREAREELDMVVGGDRVSRHVSRANSPEFESRSPSMDGWYQGLVENLLAQRDNSLRSRNTSLRGLTCRKSLDLPRTDGLSRAREEEELRADYDNAHDLSPGQHKRKRSELHEASWEQFQNHIAETRGVKEGKRSKRLHDQPQEHHDSAQMRRPAEARQKKDLTKQLPDTPHESITLVVDYTAPTRRSSLKVEAEKVHDPAQWTSHRYYVQKPSYYPPTPSEGKQSMVDEEEDTLVTSPPSPTKCHVTSPAKLHTVNEEFEWDEEIF